MINPLVVAFAIFLLAASDGRRSRQVEASADQCRQLGPCRCEYENGQGIDISQVLNKLENYMNAMDPKTQDKYFFHPCQDIRYLPTESKECSSGDGYSLCRFNNATQSYEKLGTIKDISFQSDNNGQQSLVYKLNSVVTSIQLLCLKHDQSYLYVKPDEAQKLAAGKNTTLILFSPYACPITIEEISKPSTGGVLLILFLIGTFTYFTIGSIVRFMYLGARGIEIIPNLDFWKDLPGLVRDGVRFLQNGCRVERRAPDPDSYDAI